MACKCLLVSIQDFKNVVDLSMNIGSSKLIPSITIAQDRYLANLLCPSFYDEIQTQACEDDLTPANQLLFDGYIKPALIHRAYADYLSSANLHSTASGVRTFNEQDSNEAEDKRVYRLIKKAESNADFYENKMVAFIEANILDYPTFKDECGCVNKNITRFKISRVGRSEKKIRGYKGDFWNTYKDDYDR